MSGVGEVWIRFAGQRRVEGHVGLGAGVLWFRRELERADLPIPDPELQVMTTFTGVTALRGEFAVGKRRRSRLLLTAALNSIAMKIDETWKYVPQLGISGGFAHEF